MNHTFSLSLLAALLSTSALAQGTSPSQAPMPTDATKSVKAGEKVEVKAKRIRTDSSKALLYERQASSEVKDVISAEQISRSGDSDAGAAMRRVSGITLQGGSRITIRGLGDRYSASSLNGMSLPSPDPARRQVQFDLLPSEIFESIAVQKSYTPDLPAEFGGGAAQLKTKSIPREFELKLSLGTGYSTDRVDTYKHSRTDWLGYDSGRRDLPDGLGASLTQDAQVSGAEREAITEAFPANFSVREQDAPVAKNFSVSVGGPASIGNVQAGYNLGVIYGDGWERFDRQQTELLGADLSTVNQTSTAQVSEREIRLGGLGSFALKFGDSDIRLTTGILRKTTDTVDRISRINYSAGSSDPKELYRLQWQERELVLRQLSGQHLLDEEGTIELGWRAASNSTKRNIPDERSYGYAIETIDGVRQYAHSATDNDTKLSRRYYDNSEDLREGQVDLKFRALQDDENDLSFKVGVAALERDRNSGGREFGFSTPQGYLLPTALKTGPLEGIYTPDQIRFNEATGAGILLAEEETFPSDTYQASQQLLGTFAMAQWKYNSAVDVVAGVRRETSEQSVDSVDTFSREEATVNLDHTSTLPVVSATWAFTEGQQMRAAYSRTVARPDFRELSLSSFFDYERGLRVTGNRDLEITEIDNFDLRWELYGTDDSYVSVGAFYKQLHKPIEQVPNSVSNNLSGLTFRNADSARNMGLEIEAQQNLGPAVSIGGNVMRMDSRIDVPNSNPNEFRYTNTSRAMQGAAPYAINLNTTGRIAATGTEATVLYNRLGERIMEAGVYVGEVALPDVEDVPMDLVDVVLSQRVDDRTSLKFKVSNVFSKDIEYKQDGRLVYKRTLDPAYSLSVSAVY